MGRSVSGEDDRDEPGSGLWLLDDVGVAGRSLSRLTARSSCQSVSGMKVVVVCVIVVVVVVCATKPEREAAACSYGGGGLGLSGSSAGLSGSVGVDAHPPPKRRYGIPHSPNRAISPAAAGLRGASLEFSQATGNAAGDGRTRGLGREIGRAHV